jgi:carbon storage regulator
MLVLTRKTQERIVIGRDIVVTIVRVQGQSVRIGIEAPDDVRIRRGELTPRVVEHDDTFLLELDGSLDGQVIARAVPR